MRVVDSIWSGFQREMDGSSVDLWDFQDYLDDREMLDQSNAAEPAGIDFLPTLARAAGIEFEGVEQTPDHGVGKAYRRQVGTHGLTPFPLTHEPLVPRPAAVDGHRRRRRRLREPLPRRLLRHRLWR